MDTGRIASNKPDAEAIKQEVEVEVDTYFIGIVFPRYNFRDFKDMDRNMKALLALRIAITHSSSRNLNNNVAAITKIHRETYTRTYPTTVVLSDGSSINIRYHEPRKIIKLPLDLSLLSEEEKKMRLEKRKPKKKVKIMDDIQDDFNAKKYLKYMKKK